MKKKKLADKVLHELIKKEFFDILSKEEDFKIQILSLESYKTFLEILDENKIDYAFSFSSCNIFDENKINFIFMDSEMDELADGKYILYGNSINRNFMQFKFSIPVHLKKHFCLKKDEFLYPHFNVKEIELKNIDEFTLTYDNFLNINLVENDILSELEITILFFISKYSNRSEIIKNVQTMNNANSFEIMLTLNELAENKFINCRVDKYFLNISKELLNKALDEIGFSFND